MADQNLSLRKENSNKSLIASERLAHKLKLFELLPDTALVDIAVVAVLLGRSPASIWRDVSAKRLTSPIRVGSRSTRWRAGDVRSHLKGGLHHD